MRRWFLLLSTVAYGCGHSADPCNLVSGACVSATIKGTATGLDQLRISIDKPAPETVLTPNPPRSITLPAQVALALPAGAAGQQLVIDVDGVSGGNAVAHDEQTVSVPGSGHATVTFTLQLGSTAGSDLAVTDDLGGGGGGGGTSGGDLGPCAGVTQCKSGDTCCPAGCNSTNDSDCPVVCGNGVVESGEVCDDGNTANGDACDPTCQYLNTIDTLSGKPGSQSFANGTSSVARFYSPSGVTTDGTRLFVSDVNDHTIRMIDANGNVTTIAGVSRDQRDVDGTFSQARFSSPWDIQYLGNKLYVNDDGGLRKLDLAAQTVTTLTSLGASTNCGLGSDGTHLLYCDSAGAVRTYDPTSGNVGTVVTAAALSAATNAGARDFTLGSDGNYYIVGGSTVAQVTPTGTVTLYAGASLAPGSQGCTDSATRTMAKFSQLTGIVSVGGVLYVTDGGCHTVRAITIGGGVTTYAGNGQDGTNDNANRLLAQLDQPYYLTAIGATLYVPEFNLGTVRAVTSGVSVFAGGSINWNTVYAPTGVDSRFAAASAVNINAIATDGNYIYATSSAFSSTTIHKVSVLNGGSSQFGFLSIASVNLAGIALTSTYAYVSVSNGTIYQLPLGGNTSALYAGKSGTTSPPMDGSLTTAVLAPAAMASDGTNLYFVDTSNLIREVDTVNAKVVTLAGTANTPDVLDGTGAAAHFASPYGLTFANGILYTCDGSGTVVRAIQIATGKVTTIAGHAGTYGTADGVGGAALFTRCTSLAATGKVLLVGDGTGYSDLNASVIREIELGTNRVTTMIGTRGMWTTRDGVGTQALVAYPGTMVYEPMSKVFYYYDPQEGVFQRLH